MEDVLSAGQNDSPDFGYRVRLSVGHLVEALDALADYRQHDAIRRLIARVPSDQRADLRTATSCLQRAGRNVLQDVRHHTFHYPSPASNYSPTSDAKLADALGHLTLASGRILPRHRLDAT
jgi:hypothetical protein